MALDRRSKAQRTSSTSKASEDTAKCASFEKTFVSKEDKLMICERCKEWYCIKCTKMKASVYEVLRTTKSTHWFCDDYQERAMTAVVTDRSIEETVKNYMSGMTVRMEAVEGKLETKANITDLEAMAIKIKKIEKRLKTRWSNPMRPLLQLVYPKSGNARRGETILLYSAQMNPMPTLQKIGKNRTRRPYRRCWKKLKQYQKLKIRYG